MHFIGGNNSPIGGNTNSIIFIGAEKNLDRHSFKRIDPKNRQAELGIRKWEKQLSAISFRPVQKNRNKFPISNPKNGLQKKVDNRLSNTLNI